MDAKEFALDLRRNVEDLKNKGLESIKSENLISYLDNFVRTTEASSSQTPSLVDVELYKANLQKWVEEHKNIHTHSVELFKSVIQAGQSALKTSFLMNGGGAVALLAFIGHLSTSFPDKVPLLAYSLSLFVTGVLVAGLASGVTYLSQWFYAGNKDWKTKTGFGLNIVAILFGISSYMIFGYGINEAYKFFVGFANLPVGWVRL